MQKTIIVTPHAGLVTPHAVGPGRDLGAERAVEFRKTDFKNSDSSRSRSRRV